jgi:hypothetical protein
MRTSHGHSLIELALVISIIAVVTGGLAKRYWVDRVSAYETVVRNNAQALLEAGDGWWSEFHTSPPSLAAMASAGFLKASALPVNPLGTGFVVIVTTPTPNMPLLTVTADITQPGPLADWRFRLNASDVVTGGVAWRRYVRDVATNEGSSANAFKTMY